MARQDTILNNFHQSQSQQHRQDSIGNQGVHNPQKDSTKNPQIGSIEYVPNAQTQSLDLHLHNKAGDHVNKF